jgi:Zn-dependent M28 family amino/carboxypeptidase
MRYASPRMGSLSGAFALVAVLSGGCAHEGAPGAPPPIGAPASAPPPEVATAAQTIAGDALRGWIAHLASDAFQGRGPATEGDRAARAYLEAELAAMGFEPGGGASTWEQPVPLVSVSSTMPAVWSFSRSGFASGPRASLALKWWDDYIAGNGAQTPAVTVDNAELIFAGYGIEAPEYGWDDFKGADVRGKVLLLMNNDPDWDPALFGGTTRLYYGRWTYKFENAARHGAAGAIVIHTTPSAGYPFQVVQASWGGKRFELPAEGGPRIALKAWVTEEAARSILKLAGKDLDALVASAKSRAFAPVPLGVSTSIHFESHIEHAETANVVGVLRGSDPVLSRQAIVLSAHHDHLGIGKPNAAGDAIYNGAIDNASGDAQVLGIARALKALSRPLPRTIVVLFTAAEEQNLLGSRYFVHHPLPSLGDVVADVNYDFGNVWGRTRDVTQIGRGKSSLDALAVRVAAWQGRTIVGDPFPDRGSFYRSDQFSFAQAGIPALYIDSGTDFIGKPEGWGKQRILDYEAHDYHQPSDELRPDWNFDGMVEDAQFGFYAAVEIARAASAPEWKPGDEFAARRVRP